MSYINHLINDMVQINVVDVKVRSLIEHLIKYSKMKALPAALGWEVSFLYFCFELKMMSYQPVLE